MAALFFTWLDPLVWSGFKAPLTKDQIPTVRQELEAGSIMAEFNKHFKPHSTTTTTEGQLKQINEDPEVVALMKNGKEDVKDSLVVAFKSGHKKVKQDGQSILVPFIKAFGVKFGESMILKVRKKNTHILHNMIR